MSENKFNLDINSEEQFSSEEQEALASLYKAILTLENVEEMHKFFKDLCSYNEICSMMHRWQILLKIHDGKSYEEIIKELSPKSSDVKTAEPGKRSTRKGKGRKGTTVSSTTISRVKNCYVKEDGGYRTALRRLENN